MSKFFRHAATVILASPKPKLSNEVQKTASNLQILLVKRHKDSKVMPGLQSFPGGALDPEADFDPNWAASYLTDILKLKPVSSWPSYLAGVESHFGINRLPAFLAYKPKRVEISAELETGQKIPTKVWTPSEWAFKIAALRELFEECGILVAQSKNSKSAGEIQILNCAENGEQSLDLERDRKLVHQDAKNFLAVCQKRKILPAFWLLNDWSDWLTPCAYPAKVRFDSIFYVLTLHEPLTRVTCDRSELEGSTWVDPKDMLNMANNLKMNFAPPQVYELARLANFGTAHELDSFATNRQQFGMVQFCPTIGKSSDGVSISMLPGDDLYPKNIDVSVSNLPIEKFRSTAVELRRKCTNLHRIEYPPSSTLFDDVSMKWTSGTAYINIKQPNNHIGPVTSDKNFQ